MQKFNLFVTKSSKLSLIGQNIVLHTEENNCTFPLTSIQTIMLENPRCTLSLAVIRALIDNQINVWFCDKKHLPSGCLIPFNQYYQTPLQIHAQIALSNQVKERLWTRIIKNKISNQAMILNLVKAPEAKTLERYSSGKIDNIAALEAWTARIYFKALFGKDFKRRVTNTINPSLNYGYTLIKSSIAKNLASLGIQPALGIFHAGQKNNFNLADDLLEPFRPIIDFLVWLRQNKLSLELTLADKQYLLSMLSLPLTSNNSTLLDLSFQQSKSFNTFLTSRKPSDLININFDTLKIQELEQWKNY